MTGLPTVPVHDLKIHPRDRELIPATHGRSLWIVDIAPLEQLADSILRKDAHLFAIKPAYQYTLRTEQAWNGNKRFQVDNPPYGAELVLRLASGDAKKDTARVVVTDVKGDTVRSFPAAVGAGFNRLTWDLRRNPKPLGPKALRDSIAGARRRQQRADSVKAAAQRDTSAKHDTTGGPTVGVRAARTEPGSYDPRPAEAPPGITDEELSARSGFGRRRIGDFVEPGEYLVTVSAGGKVLRQVVKVERVGEVVADEAPEEEH
jgi:hypothetical protein